MGRDAGESAGRADGVAGTSTTLRAEASSGSAARQFISDVLRRRGLDPLADVGALLTSELVTNAFLDVRSDVVLQVMVKAGKCVWFALGSAKDDKGAERRLGLLFNLPAATYVAWVQARQAMTAGGARADIELSVARVRRDRERRF